MITGLNHLTLAVTDLDRSFEFYRDVMGFRPLCRWEKGAYFRLGELWFCLNVDPKRMPQADYTHYAFTVAPENFAKMSAQILDSGARIFQENTSPGESLYFLDPDGHKLELHASDWQGRLAMMQAQGGKVEFFNE